jgi:hypothetical protein
VSERTQLLTDIKAVFANRDNPDELATADLLEGLIALDESPWRGWWAKEDSNGDVRVSKGAAQKLSTHLKPLKVKSQDIGPKEHRRKGYLREDFEPVWQRYLPADPDQDGAKAAHPAHSALQSQKTALPSRAPDAAVRDFETSENGSTEPSARGARLDTHQSGLTQRELDYAEAFRERERRESAQDGGGR